VNGERMTEESERADPLAPSPTPQVSDPSPLLPHPSSVAIDIPPELILAPSDSRPALRPLYSLHLTILGISLAVAFLAAVLHVRGETQVVLPLFDVPLPELCYWRRMLGIDCPGCGLTRSFISLAHGEIARAWHFNPSGLVLFAGLIFQFPYRGLQLWRLARGKPEWTLPGAVPLVLVACATVVVQWLWRMAA
jgi:hypothetical protein